MDVYLPDPVYEVWPAATRTYPGNDSLRIKYSNVQLRGAGRFQTTISCKVAGGLDPNTHWELPGGVVWRGNGIQIVGSSISNTRIANLRLTGNSPRTLTKYPVWGGGVQGGISFPADPVTGENWDITNKGIFVGDGTTRTNTIIEDCEIDSFRGELFYYGGLSSTGLRVRRCVIHDSLASMFSCGGELAVEDSDLSYGLNAVEDTPFGLTQVIQRNWFHDNVHGVTYATNQAPPALGAGRVVIRDNRFTRISLANVFIYNCQRGVWVVGNEFTDYAWAAVVMGGPGVDGTGPQDITVERNLFRMGEVQSSHAIEALSDLGNPATYRIVNNRMERSAYGKAQNWPMVGIYKALNEPSSVCYESGNDWSGGEA